jgi:hypothetical protein
MTEISKMSQEFRPEFLYAEKHSEPTSFIAVYYAINRTGIQGVSFAAGRVRNYNKSA